MKFKFQAKYLPMLAPFMARQDLRYYLNGINVRPWGDGVLLAATDGHTLGLVYDTEGRADREYTLAVTDATIRAAGSKPRLGVHWLVSQDLPDYQGAPYNDVTPPPTPRARLAVMVGAKQGSITDDDMGALDLEIHIQAGNALIDGKYPDVRRVIPARKDLKPGAPGAYNAHYLTRLARAGRASRFPVVRFYAVNEPGALVCHLPETPEFMALIMPLRDDPVKSWAGGLPDWIANDNKAPA